MIAAVTLLAIQEATRFDAWSASLLCFGAMSVIHLIAFWGDR